MKADDAMCENHPKYALIINLNINITILFGCHHIFYFVIQERRIRRLERIGHHVSVFQYLLPIISFILIYFMYSHLFAQEAS